MAIKLTNIRPVGRFVNKETGKAYNIRKGRRVGRSTDHLFYLYRGSRQFITDADFYSDKWEEENKAIYQDVDEAYYENRDCNPHHFHYYDSGMKTYKKEYMHLYRLK